MRRRGLISPGLQITNRKSQIQQRGYMMITLMLALALIMIGLLAVLPEVKQQIVRDREDELRHRGTAYMRAIQHFYKKFGRYPTRVEELENTNNLRFLRKRYTDPVNIDKTTGKEKDFKFLHQQDISLNSGMVLGQTPGTNLQGGASNLIGGGPGQSGFGGGQVGVVSNVGFGAQSGGLQPTANQNSASGSSGNAAATGGSSDDSSSGNSDVNSNGSSSSGSPSSNSINSSNLGGQTFGGGPILGVASTSKGKSIHVFYTKNHYNDWLFIYLPMADRGGLLNGPVNPTGGVTSGIPGAVTPGTPGMPGGMPGQGGFGQTSFGQGGSQGFGGQSPQSPTPQAPSQPPQ
ncbi:MAG TPA: type II secretion system protein [Terriglobales bacterium]|jgi:type II secretory pathway pseudopilin PulG|nr:type II secretion system protein [Terriglobales bacterium]